MKFLRFGICLMITFAVALHGIVEVWSESIFEIVAALLLVYWAVLILKNHEYEIHGGLLLWPLLGLLGFGGVQLALHWTVYPFHTQTDLLRWSAITLYLFLFIQAFRTRRELQTFAWFLLVLGFATGLFGIAQRFTFNGKIYWFRELELGGLPFGPFVNRNHFAGLMELIAPLGLALLTFRGIRRDLIPLGILFVIIQISSLLLSSSRGGIISFFFSVGILFLITWLRKTDRTSFGILAMVLLAGMTLLVWLGVGQVASRFEKIGPGEVSLTRRAVMIRGSWKIFLAHPWTGTGAGTLVDVYPKYEGLYDGKVVEHSHNDYVELLADMGGVGGVCGLAFLIIFLAGALPKINARQGHFSAALHAGAFAAVCGLMLHSTVDFNLHIPSNATLFLIQAYLAASPVLETEDLRQSGPIRRRSSRAQPSAAVDRVIFTGP
jgi:O-antigen ligase